MEQNGKRKIIESWKKTGIIICFIVWIGTFIVGHHMEESSVFKVNISFDAKFSMKNDRQIVIF